jgi:hypothetical protein
VGEFIAKWAHKVQTSMLAKSISHLDEYTPEQLRMLYREMGLPQNITSSVVHIGYDYDMGKFRGFAYQSLKDFNSEELKHGFYTRPTIPNFQPTENLLDDFKRIIAIQREEDLSQPLEDRIGIGGEIHVLVLEPGKFTILQSHKFEDYEILYDQMCDELPANKGD